MTDPYRTPPGVVRRNAFILIGTVLLTFVTVRVALFASPDSDLTVGPHTVHHLFTGQLLIVLGGIPLAIFRGHTRRLDLALVVFGVGLALALDEWVYLIATDGSNASYLLPVSFWGGLVVVSLALAYAAAIAVHRLRARGSEPPAGGARMRTGALLLVLVTSFPAPSRAQAPVESPQQVTSRFMGAMQAGDWTGMAGLMHPAALRQLRGLLAALFEAPDADDVRQRLLGVTTVAEAQAMSDTALFAALMRFTTEQSPGLAEILRSARLEVLGQVEEGRDTTHVVYRMAMTIQGTSVTRMDVMSLARSPDGWRGLLKGDVSAFAAAIRAAVAKPS